MLLLNLPELCSDNVYSFKKYFIRIAKQHICNALANIRNIYIKYTHCGLMNFNIPVSLQIVFYQIYFCIDLMCYYFKDPGRKTIIGISRLIIKL